MTRTFLIAAAAISLFSSVPASAQWIVSDTAKEAPKKADKPMTRKQRELAREQAQNAMFMTQMRMSYRWATQNNASFTVKRREAVVLCRHWRRLQAEGQIADTLMAGVAMMQNPLVGHIALKNAAPSTEDKSISARCKAVLDDTSFDFETKLF